MLDFRINVMCWRADIEKVGKPTRAAILKSEAPCCYSSVCL